LGVPDGTSFPADWMVDTATLIADGLGGKVWQVVRARGGMAVVKQASEAGREDARRGGDFLRWRGGRGAVHLIDRRGDLSLLEHVAGGDLLTQLDTLGDDEATRIAADVLRLLHAPSPAPWPASLQPLPDHFASLFAKARLDRQAGRHSLFVEAAQRADALLADQQDVRPLHGDIHHENILRGTRGWLAIDPKGLIGDPAYDFANLFYNPLERDDLRADPERARRMAAILAQASGREAGVILDFGFCHACLSASWHVEDGNHDEAARSLGVAETLRAACLRP